MALLMEYKPGGDLTRPLNFTLSTRAVAGYQFGSNGYLKRAEATALRDSHWLNGVRTTLLEQNSVNHALQSQALSTSPWSVSAASTNVTPTATNGVAPDGTLTAVLMTPDTDNAINHYFNQPITITADENIAVGIFLKSSGYSGVRVYYAESLAGTNAFYGDFDLTGAGQTSGNKNGTGVFSGSKIIPLANGWYWCLVWGKVMNGATSSQLMPFIFPTYATINQAYAGNGTSAILAWGAQVERFGTTITGQPTSYIATTTATVTRNQDVISAPWPHKIQQLWWYMKFYDIGWSSRADFANGPMLCKNISGDRPRLRFMTGSGTAGQTPNHRFNWEPNLGPSAANQAAAMVNAAVTYGDEIELFGRFLTPGRAELTRTVNGGSLTTNNVNAVGGIPFLEIGTAPVLFLNSTATLALRVLKIGADPLRITTLALAAEQ